MNANIWRNGANFGVFVNTGIEYDCSDTGATISEAITWGKMQINSTYIKIYSDASLVFPIMVAETFAKHKDIATKL
jgi:deoxyhypusine synthase